MSKYSASYGVNSGGGSSPPKGDMASESEKVLRRCVFAESPVLSKKGGGETRLEPDGSGESVKVGRVPWAGWATLTSIMVDKSQKESVAVMLLAFHTIS